MHPGAANHYDAEETSLLGGLSDWFWVGMLGLGGVARNPVFAAGEIAPGELGIMPLMPAKEVQTLTFPLLLVASNRLASKAVQEFTKQLFSLRHALLAQNPEAGRIEKLSTDRGESFAVHPGAATYYDAEETSLLGGLSDWFWVGMLGLGGIGSMGAWILSRLFPRRREMVQAEFTELLVLMEKARGRDFRRGGRTHRARDRQARYRYIAAFV